MRELRAALACASGGSHRVRTDALQRLHDRLNAYGGLTATLGGARVLADEGDEVTVGRDPGRAPPGDIALAPGAPAVWDGRFEATAEEDGWRVGGAAGRLARLPRAERDELARLPAALRGAHPLFVRGEDVRLRPDGVALRGLVPARYDAAVGRMRREAEVA